MTTDPFPVLTSFLNDILLYLIYIGIILATISGVVAGILYLPIFGFSERRATIGATALKLTAIGLIIILLAIPARNLLVNRFLPPVKLPPIPLLTPSPTH